MPATGQFWFTASQNWAGPGKSSSGVTKSRKMTYQGLANSGLWQAGISMAPESHLPRFCDAGSHLKPEKIIWWNQLPKVIIRGRAIPACPKPELIGIFKLTFMGLKNLGKWLLDRVMSEILKPLKMVLCSSHEIVSLNIVLTCRAPSILQWI